MILYKIMEDATLIIWLFQNSLESFTAFLKKAKRQVPFNI